MNDLTKKSISIIGIIFSIIMLILVLNKIELYSDDFYYKSFLKGDFIKLNIEHYEKVNGRVLVHILDEIMLNMNIYVYIAFLILCLSYDFYFVSKFILLKTNYYSKENLLYSIGISFILFLLIDVYVLKETAFWITGAFNYVLPITISFIALSVITKVLNENKINIIQIILIFIAGATTEQGFIITFLLTIGYFIIHNLDKKIIINKNEIIILISEILGFLTIFLSPASRRRAIETKTIFNSSIFDLIEENFETFAERIVGENSIYIIISLFVISIAFLSLKEKRLNKILISGFFIGIPIILANLLEKTSSKFNIIMTVALIVYVLISIIELFKIKNLRNISLMLCAAFLLQGATFLLGEISYRALFILSLICVICAANNFTIFINGVGGSIARPVPDILVTLLIILGTTHMLPIIKGYSYNKSIFDDMRASIENYEEKGYVEINLNIDNRYAHTMGYLNGDFYDYFMVNYGIKEIEKDVYFFRDEASKIFINGKRIKYPAILKENIVYVPTRYVAEALEGKCEWTIDKTKYFFDKYYVIIDNFSKKIIESSKKEYVNIELSDSIENYMNRSYINIEDLKYIIGEVRDNIKVGLDI